jgi:hypothetical protein
VGHVLMGLYPYQSRGVVILKSRPLVSDELIRLRFPLLPVRERSHFHRGGRYRKPPEAKKSVATEPGVALMRDRRGRLVPKRVAIETTIDKTPAWGMF